MGRRRKAGKYPYDYTDGDDRRFADSGAAGTLRVLHGPGRGMGVTEGVLCRVEVLAADGHLLDESEAGKFGKEHRLHGTAPGDRVTVMVWGRYAADDGCACGAAALRPRAGRAGDDPGRRAHRRPRRRPPVRCRPGVGPGDGDRHG